MNVEPDGGLDARSPTDDASLEDAGADDASLLDDGGPPTDTAVANDAPTFECIRDGECSAPPNVAVACRDNVCVSLGCESGFDDCDGNLATGCEQALGSTAHCRGCGDACTGTEVCSPTGCTADCTSPLTACTGSCVDLDSNASHCGFCGNACSTPSRARPVCEARACSFTCDDGYGDCSSAEGCETDLLNDAANCGACARACDGTHGTVRCLVGACSVEACDPDRGDCDGDGLNGCETSLRDDDAHCGVCGRACAPGSRCTAGACVPYLDGDFGADHACAVRADGRVLCWGRNESGQADPTETPRAVEEPITMRVDPATSGSEPIIARDVGLGRSTSCVVLADGTLACWGANQLGQLGDGTTTARARPTPPVGDAAFAARRFVSVDGWHDHHCALDTEGEVWCWGVGTNGETGTVGTTVRTALRVGLPMDATAVAVAERASCALLVDGRVFCWGLNTSGRLGRGDPSNAGLAPAVVAAGPGSASRLFGAAAGFCVIDVARDLYCWGSNVQGQYAPTPMGSELRSPVRVATAVDDVSLGTLHVCWWSDGQAFCRGRDVEGQRGLGPGDVYATETPARVSEIDGLRATFSGRNTTCGIGGDRMRCFGASGVGEIPRAQLLLETATRTFLGTGLSRLSIGASHSCMARSGEVWCMGSNGSSELGLGTLVAQSTPQRVPGLTGVIDVTVSTSMSCAIGAGVSGPDQLHCWGSSTLLASLGLVTTSSPREASLSGAERRVVLGFQHGCIVRSTGTLACFGRNTSGELGIGTTSTSEDPTDIAGLSDVVDVAVGTAFSCALERDGDVWCWGANASGQLGDGTRTMRTLPVRIAGLSATEIEAGHEFACAVDSSGAVRCWGANDVGQLGDLSYTERTTPVAVAMITSATTIGLGFSHACAIVAAGEVRCWGAGFQHQLGVDPPITSREFQAAVVGAPPSAILSTGPTALSSCGVDPVSGTVACWGANPWGLLGGGETIHFALTDVVLR